MSDNLTLEIKVKSTTGSYAGNYGDLAFHAISQCDQIPGTENVNLNAGKHSGAGYETDKDDIGNIKNGRWSIYTIYNNENAYVDMKMDITYFKNAGQVKVTVTDAFSGNKEAEQTFDITENATGKVFSIDDPIRKGLKTIRFDYITSSDGYIMNYKNLQFNKRADYTPSTTLTVSRATIDDVELTAEALEAIKEDGGSHTLTGNIYTTVPMLAVTMSDLSSANVTSSVDGNSNSVTYTIKATDFQSTLTLEGLHTYAKADDETAVDLKYTSDGKQGNGTWSNGLYTLETTSLDGWNNSSFKLNGTEYTLKMPSNIQVKQLVFKDLGNNYDGNASITAVTTDGATNIWFPTKRYALKDKNYDLVVNIEGHVPGTPIIFNLDKQGQPFAWLQLITKETTDGNPTIVAQNATVVDNHAVISLQFDREVKDMTTTFNGKTYTAEGGSSAVYFQLWDLDYSHDYTFTVDKAAIVDNNGKTATADVNIAFSTAAKPAVAMAAYDYVVGNAEELDAAIAALAESNKTADAPRKTVFLKNGNYTYGTLTGSYKHNVSLKIDNWNNIHNVSLIGESKEGVIIEGTTDGITSSTIDLGNGVGNYLQDLTIRNNYDFRAETLKGVSVAVTGGNKTVLKNIAMQASQDTYVTGSRTYLEDCDIYGTTDFICGGGDIYFERCNLILGNKSGNVITAPSTSPDLKWGYVFQNCVVDADKGADNATDKSYNLGRPWQNEPRAYFLNTTMNVLCSDAGWTKMSNLPTHFYEYKSVDKNGNLIDLSVRQNSPSSTNTYTPVLTDEEAARFTLRNVLGGTDSWDAIAETVQMPAPTNAAYSDGKLTWDAVEDAMLYVVFLDGEYLANTTACEFATTTAGRYTVKAANKNGGLGAEKFCADVYDDETITLRSPYGTYQSQNAYTMPEGLTGGVITGAANDGKLTISWKYTEGTVVPAQAALLIKDNATDKTAVRTFTAKVVTSDEKAPAGNLLHGAEAVDAEGKTYVEGDAKYYILSYDTNGENFGFYWGAAEGAAVKYTAPYCFLAVPAASAAKGFVLEGFGDDTNGIDNAKTATTSNDTIYNMMGVRMNGDKTTLSKGMYIMNGKKVIVK